MDEFDRLRFISQCALFNTLDSTIRDFLASRATSRVFAKGSALASRNARLRGLTLLCSGLVKASITSWGGREFILEICSPGDVLELGSLLSGTNPRADYIAETGVTVLQVPHSAIAALADEPAFLLAARSYLINANVTALRQVELLALRSLRERLALRLLEFFSAPPALLITYPRYFTQERLALLTNATRPKVNGHLQVFKSAGAIHIDAGKIQITNPDRLATFMSPD